MNSDQGRDRDHTSPKRSLSESKDGMKPATRESVLIAIGAEADVVAAFSAGAGGTSDEVLSSVKVAIS